MPAPGDKRSLTDVLEPDSCEPSGVSGDDRYRYGMSIVFTRSSSSAIGTEGRVIGVVSGRGVRGGQEGGSRGAGADGTCTVFDLI